jgi:hypothetical protein
MFGERYFYIVKPLLGLMIVVLILAMFIWLRTSLSPKQVVFNCSRFLSRENTNFKTRNYEQLKTEHFLIKYGEVNRDNAPIVAEAAEEIYEPVVRMFNFEPSKPTMVVMYPDSASLAEAFGWDRAERAMGVYWAGTIRILNPDEWIIEGDKRQTFIREGPMAHEFAHLLVDCLTLGNYPRWYTEGVAQYVEKKITGFELFNPAKYNNQSVEYYDFATLEQNFDQLVQGIAYGQSLQATELIAERYGEDKVFAILGYLGQGYDMKESFAKATGESFDEFEYDLLAIQRLDIAV